jgi:hypothetical protein
MEVFKKLLKKDNMGELILVVLFIIYLVLGLRTPELIANIVDNVIGKVVVILVVIYLFMNANPVLAVLSALVAFDLMRRSTDTTGLGALQKYAPTEEKKMTQFTAFNQFPYTLEQEVVSKMAPIVRSGSSIIPASYKPLLDNLHDASHINGSN